MNRPTNAPCWIVGVWLDGREMWLLSPTHARVLRETAINYGVFRFTTRTVEPFLDELSAIAAALVVDGHVVRVDAGEDET